MGKLYFYYSAMNAGKTTTLLQSAFNYNERGMKCLLFTPLIDDRYGTGVITSRIGLQAEAISFSPDFNFHDYIGPLARDNSCVLVDEAQFLTKDQVFQLTNVVDDFNLPVLAYGLRSDFRGDPFEGAQYLMSWADEIDEIKTICHCGKKATFNARVNESGAMESQGEQIEIGGNARYISLCRRHFKQGVTMPSRGKGPGSLKISPCKFANNNSAILCHDDDGDKELVRERTNQLKRALESARSAVDEE